MTGRRPVPRRHWRSSLICPWRKRPVLLWWQAAQLAEARQCLALVPGRVRYAWVTAERVTPIATPEQSWIDRKIFDGMRVSARVTEDELAAA